MSSHDPLQLLIHGLMHKPDEILLLNASRSTTSDFADAEFVSFPNPSGTEAVVLPKNTPTRYKRDESSRYDLQSLLFCALSKDASAGEYVSKASKANVQFVTTIERQSVLDLLHGKRAPGPELDLLPEEEGPRQVSDATNAQRPAKRVKYQVNKDDQEAVRQIQSSQESRSLLDRDTMLRGTKPANFEYVRSLVAERLKSFKEDIEKLDKGNALLATPSRPHEQGRKRAQHPIIIVSPSSSALITMSNVKRFLEDGVFEHASSTGKSAEDVITVYHRRQIGTLTAPAASAMGSKSGLGSASQSTGERQARYFIVDSVEALSKFGEDSWERVVCVMTTGQEWQFRPYKWAEPKELFHHVKGIYFSQTTDLPNPKISSWNVTELKAGRLASWQSATLIDTQSLILQNGMSTKLPWHNFGGFWNHG